MSNKILIGYLSRFNKGALQVITQVFIAGLSSRYRFVPYYKDRRVSFNQRTTFNLINLYYLAKHYFLWLAKIIVHRPALAHYHITSFLNMEKSLLFLMTAKFFGARTIGHLNGGSFDVFWHHQFVLRRKLASLMFSKLDVLIVTSSYWHDFMKKNTNVSRIEVVSNPIETQFENAARKFVYQKDGYILFVGSLGKRKGVYDILKAVDRIKGRIPKILIVGPEETRRDLKQLKGIIRDRQLDRYIEIVGPLYDADKIKIFGEAGLFLFPSYNENFPLVVLEAAAAGLPIITTRVGALPEYFRHDESVVFIEPGNVEEMATALMALTQDGEKRVRLGQGARGVFECGLSNKHIISALDRIYADMLTG